MSTTFSPPSSTRFMLDELTASGPVRNGESLSRHTTIKVGGTARWFALPDSEEELVVVLQAAQHDGVRVQNLGGGSNMVPSDKGFDGLVLKLGGGFAWHRVEGHKLVAGGATLLPLLTKFAVKNRLGNFEWACGIPGAVGGSIWGNAGSRGWNGHDFEGRDAQADLKSVVVFDRTGRKRVLDKGDIEFSYRRSSLGDLVVTEATFALKPLSEEQAKNHADAVKELLRLRRESQPVSAASAGCAWKNPKMEGCASAGQLVEQLGLKGLRVGGAEVSTLHGNFVINSGGASAEDVRQLLHNVEQRVLDARGIVLEREVRLLD
ncbi:MAG TPA: UDP-N-acetylmuramate dehydrogenase [Abditibacteriaceae bacterium]|nr:UDP-N-acetylmuramate dehydrogenase [Abditibacteriaceae bacterium]